MRGKENPSFFILWYMNLGLKIDGQTQFLLVNLMREHLGKEIQEDTGSDILIELYNLKSSKIYQIFDSDRK